MFQDTFENIFPSLFSANQRQVYNGLDRTREDVFAVKLDVSQFKPVELSVKVEGTKLIVSGKHQNKSKNGSENCDFTREYEIPPDVEPASIASRITPTGVLIIEAEVRKTDASSSFGMIYLTSK